MTRDEAIAEINKRFATDAETRSTLILLVDLFIGQGHDAKTAYAKALLTMLKDIAHNKK